MFMCSDMVTYKVPAEGIAQVNHIASNWGGSGSFPTKTDLLGQR